MSTRRLQISALLALALVATVALRAHGAPTAKSVGAPQQLPLRQAAPAPAPAPAAAGPSLDAQVAELRAQTVTQA